MFNQKTGPVVFFLATFLPVTILALPTMNAHMPRAGGPSITPIPPTCTVTNPLLSLPPGSYVPGPSTNEVLLYSAYYSASPSTNSSTLSEQCIEQCYGYGTHTECQAAFWAEKLVVPKGYYGTAGGYLETGCLLFGRKLEVADFVPGATEGEGQGGVGGNIDC